MLPAVARDLLVTAVLQVLVQDDALDVGPCGFRRLDGEPAVNDLAELFVEQIDRVLLPRPGCLLEAPAVQRVTNLPDVADLKPGRSLERGASYESQLRARIERFP